ncbi:NAD(P)H-binding protein [Chryseobacterium culicis]|uniref:NAD-dependent dehydratase n=1 Tax=Chryseobacterium culicis TaxID=680127 RepID=A0A2S9D015_CHRCI|nr:NAD(P)H-binding protein [Chryseobacterium culicis]PRB86050.1 NAD-dependent dehydratase [Chryseobacterium culicis]PRB91803.1 NAD-dependent dehydratase [Chryseobacterium culicis]
MNIVLTGSIGNIGKPLTEELIQKGHSVTVISSTIERMSAIEALGAKAAIGSMFDPDFLTDAFTGADIVYLMETMEAAGDFFDKDVDFIGKICEIGHHYKTAVERSGVKKIIHLSSIGAHTDKGTGIIVFHHHVENILKQLPDEVTIKFIRPVGIYFNMFSFISTIKNKGVIISNWGGDQKEPWVSPLDIAAVIAEETEKPFEGRTVRYVASDEVSPNEIAKALGNSIGKPDLQWKVISDQELLKNWLDIGFNEQVARGFVETQVAQGSGILYEDYDEHQPVLGKVKLADFAKEFAEVYQNDEV